MNSTLVFIYDGECPFCNQFAELLELKSNLPNITIKDARKDNSELPNGYDMDIKGAVLIKNGEMIHGAKAINWICSNIENPSDSLLRVIIKTFSSSQRTNLLFPLLLIARRLTLILKGVPRKIRLSSKIQMDN